jgi:putative intracellular protease/amidase
MRQTRKGNQWYFGMKAHIGVDSKTKIIHSAAATAANVADCHLLPDLLHGEETRVWGDHAYHGQCGPGSNMRSSSSSECSASPRSADRRDGVPDARRSVRDPGDPAFAGGALRRDSGADGTRGQRDHARYGDREPRHRAKSSQPAFQTDATRRFEADPEAKGALGDTRNLLEATKERFDAVFYPGGHGPLWDLAEDPVSIGLIEAAVAAGKPVAAVCHAPGVLRHVKSPDGRPLVQGKAVTGFANTEEEAVGLTKVVPFLVEDMLIRNGGLYSKGGDWCSHVVTDGQLITGQNPASSEDAARALLKVLA